MLHHIVKESSERGGLPRCFSRLLSSAASIPPSLGITKPRSCAIIGAPYSWGQPRAGTDLAPALLRGAGLKRKIDELGWKSNDLGDVIIPSSSSSSSSSSSAALSGAEIRFPDSSSSSSSGGGMIRGLRNQIEVGRGNHAICNAVANASKSNDFVLTLGGDHSIALGSISGVLSGRGKEEGGGGGREHGDLAVLWIDAHADINDPITSPSGNIHGMPLSFLLRLFDPVKVEGYEWLGHVPSLNKERLCYIGLRDLDAGEKDFIKRLGIRAFTMQDIDRHGIGKVMELAIDHIQRKLPGMTHAVPVPLHLSFDIDALDPTVAPATGTRVKGGLSYREAHYVCEAAAETGLLTSMDMVEVNPKLGNDEEAKMTVNLAVELVQSALGKSILGGER